MRLPFDRHSLIVGTAALFLSGAGIAWAFDPPPRYGARIASVAIVGPPPTAGSPADAADRAAFARTAADIGGRDWQAGQAELFLNTPAMTTAIGCAISRRLAPDVTPVTTRLLAAATADLRAPVESAKAFYKRDRPYVGAADGRTCDPRSLGSATGGTLSYSWPSGHAAYGRLVARILAAATPARGAAITAWGDGVGDHRVACRVHWPSDVAAGRRLADALYTDLAAKPRFIADLAAARAELGTAPEATDCPSPGIRRLGPGAAALTPPR